MFSLCVGCVWLFYPKNERRKVVLYLECMSVNGLERESRERESESSWPISTRWDFRESDTISLSLFPPTHLLLTVSLFSRSVILLRVRLAIQWVRHYPPYSSLTVRGRTNWLFVTLILVTNSHSLNIPAYIQSCLPKPRNNLLPQVMLLLPTRSPTLSVSLKTHHLSLSLPFFSTPTSNS